MRGTNGPEFMAAALQKLKPLLPQATMLELDGLMHNAPDEQDPAGIAKELLRFFGEEA
jgi:hypothetical protein